MRLGKRAFLVWTFAGVAALAVTAAQAEDIVLNFLNVQSDDTYKKAIADFEASHPGITIREQKLPFDSLNAQVQARIGSGDTSIDLYDADPPRISALVKKGLLADLTEWLPEVQEKLLPATIVPAVVDGKLYAIPRATSMVLMFYNKDLLEKAGVPLPSADPDKRLTWEEVLDGAKKAQAAGAKWGIVPEQIDRYYQLQPLYESSGAGPGVTGDGLMTPAVNTDKWIETTKWYADLFANGVAPRGIDSSQTAPLFFNGEAAYFVAGPWEFGGLLAQDKVNWGIAPHPYFAGGKPVTPTDGWTIGVSPHSPHIKEAAEFALFVAENKDVALDLAKTTLPPASKEAFPEYLASVSTAPQTKDWGKLLEYELANTAVSRPKTSGYIAFEEILNKAFNDVRNGSDVKEVLDAAEDQLSSVFGRMQ